MLKDKLISLCANYPNDYEIRAYSGRGMFGRTCLGIVVNRISKLFHLGAEVGDLAFDVATICVDSMGCDSIVYFPEIDLNQSEIDGIEIEDENEDD